MRYRDRVLSLLGSLRALLVMRSWQRAKGIGRDHGFTADEMALLEVLARLIVPSGDTSPGAAQLREVGPSAAELLDQLVAGSPSRQAVYARGLADLNQQARRQYKTEFVDLRHDDQVQLLQHVERLGARSSSTQSFRPKVRAKLLARYHQWTSPAVEWFPTLVQDVLTAFYTSPVSWAWLGYDGPPMPEGYRYPPEVRSPREDAAPTNGVAV